MSKGWMKAWMGLSIFAGVSSMMVALSYARLHEDDFLIFAWIGVTLVNVALVAGWAYRIGKEAPHA